jgi:uncharacterized protein (DUF4415 family)
MATKTIGGISGVLGELISTAPLSEDSPRQEHSSPPKQEEPHSTDAQKSTAHRPCRARLGRPPGSSTSHMRPKEKVTLRIPSDLIAEYRDWSWEARCQLSELVERALVTYQESRRR